MPSEVVGVSLPVDVKEALDGRAAELQLSRSALITQLVRQGLQNGQPLEVKIDGVRWQPAERKNPWAKSS